MKSKNVKIILLFSVLFFIAACNVNSNDSEIDTYSTVEETDIRSSNDFVAMEMDEASPETAMDAVEEKEMELVNLERMVIHQAQLSINVNDIDQTQTNIETKVIKYEGYIVQSNIYREKNTPTNGYMLVRIPAEHFQSFLSDTEEAAAEVLEQSVTGDDVTDQYVDLESRLKSKRIVEERLLEFMEAAVETEDLLQISNDLANVQEEIEVIVGHMNLLENQIDFSTIEITMFDNSVIIPDVDSEDLNTWEKTKKQLATSTNFLLAAGSGIIVFMVGNLPVFAILLIVGLIVYFGVRRRKNRNN